MKKLLYIFLISSLLSFTSVSGYIYADDASTIEEDTTEESTTEEDTETLTETLNDNTEEKSNGVTTWTILIAVLGASLFIGVAYYIVKNFNL